MCRTFSGIDVFDIEIHGKDPDKLVDIIARLEPTLGGINLQDIRALELGHTDVLLCGLVGRYDHHLEHVRAVIGVRRGADDLSALTALMLDKHTLFIADTFVNDDPDAQTLAEIAEMAAEAVTHLGIEPKVAFLSHSIDGSSQSASARKMRAARALFAAKCPDVQSECEVQGDSALSEESAPSCPATAQKISQRLGTAEFGRHQHHVQRAQDHRRPSPGVTAGPIFHLARCCGARACAHASATVCRIVNLTVLTVVQGRLR